MKAISSARPACHPLGVSILSLVALSTLGYSTADAATKYWDVLAGAGNGVGGSGSWAAQTTNIFSTTLTGDASLTSAATGDDDIFQGSAGTITLGASVAANSLTFNTTGYKVTGSSATTRTVTGGISLASSVNLSIGNGETTDIAIGVGSISGSSGSGLTINGSAAGGAVIRLNLSTGTTPTISVPIAVTGTGFANISGGAAGTQVTGTVTGSGARLNLGATSGNAITFTQTIDNGTGTVRIAAGSSGGAGVVTLSGTSNNWGTTELNNAASGILRMGAVNALPTATTLTFGATSSNGNSIVELSGKDTTIGQLTNGGQSGGTLRNTSAAGATLTISGSDTAAAAFSGALQDGTGGGALSLIRSGTGTTTLTGTNTYTGTTSVTGGTLLVSGSATGSITSAATVSNSGSTLGGSGTVANVTINTAAALQGGDGVTATGALSSAGNVTLNDGSQIKLTLGASGTHSSLARTGGTWSFDSDQAFTLNLLGAEVTTYDNIITGLTGSETGLGSIGSWLITNPGVTGTFSYDGSGGVDLVITAVPEPSAFASAALGAGLLMTYRRFRRTMRIGTSA